MSAPVSERAAYAALRATRSKQVVTPEGTPLLLEIGRLGDRASALLIDGLIILMLAILGLLALRWMTEITGFVLLDLLRSGFFLWLAVLRMFYFTWHELRRNGATPGKRRMGLRVVDAGGGQLTSEAILTRNFMREVELWLPLGTLAGHDGLFPAEGPLARLLALAWIFALMVVPLLHPDRRRIGDLVAGTVVVVLPRSRLLPDLGRADRPRILAPSMPARYAFTREQLEIYGNYELQVLEDVLRATGFDRHKTFATVCEKIKRKIGWPESEWDVEAHAFLRDFYRAQRARLEQRMLLGDRKERKSGPPSESP